MFIEMQHLLKFCINTVLGLQFTYSWNRDFHFILENLYLWILMKPSYYCSLMYVIIVIVVIGYTLLFKCFCHTWIFFYYWMLRLFQTIIQEYAWQKSIQTTSMRIILMWVWNPQIHKKTQKWFFFIKLL